MLSLCFSEEVVTSDGAHRLSNINCYRKATKLSQHSEGIGALKASEDPFAEKGS